MELITFLVQKVKTIELLIFLIVKNNLEKHLVTHEEIANEENLLKKKTVQ